MNKNTYINKVQALDSVIIGFEFEFMTEMYKNQIQKSLIKCLGKNIILSDKYHSKIGVDANNFKLEPDYSGGSKMYELITGPLPYHEALPIFLKAINWIDKNGYTTDSCSFQFSVSFDKFNKSIKTKIEHIDKLKFILNFDEGLIYSKFGNRANNVYTKSIKRIIPRNRFYFIKNLVNIDSKIFKMPNSKYYGVNFSKLEKGYLEIRYIGGRDYQKKIRAIREIIEYVCLYLYDLLSGRISGYSSDDIKKLEGMMREHYNVVKSFSNPDRFFVHYPDFHILIDLKGHEEIIKTYYTVIREKIFDLIVDAGVTRGFLNYDSGIGKFQLKDAKIRGAFEIKDMDLIDCNIKNSVLDNCNLYNCNIKSSEILNSKILSGNEIKKSKIQNTPAEYGNELIECFIDSEGLKIDCNIEGGVLRAGNTATNAKVSEETEIVKGWAEKRSERFITDSRLKNKNEEYPDLYFKNRNY